jgi:hypothetical protein
LGSESGAAVQLGGIAIAQRLAPALTDSLENVPQPGWVVNQRTSNLTDIAYPAIHHS